MLKAEEVKRILYDMGADLCGVASIDRFDGAPEGFHPLDVLPSCQSVVVFAKKFPAGTMQCKTPVPYTISRNMLADILDKMAVQFCNEMEQFGVVAAPTSAISHNQLDAKAGRFRGIVSAKHCAVAAGLGRIGKNTLVATPEYGSVVWLVAVLTDAPLEADEVLTGDPCPAGCSICIDNCPAHALGNAEMNQRDCFAHAFHTDSTGTLTITCHLCRTQCPNCLGSKNKHLLRGE